MDTFELEMYLEGDRLVVELRGMNHEDGWLGTQYLASASLPLDKLKKALDNL